MGAGLRCKVIERAFIAREFSMSERGNTASFVWKYDTHETLECGHIIRTRGMCSPRYKTKVCKVCK